tara:strand:+ start:2646 stop:3599 length:954 start_codon:yes stop_codon:yes gene_type:complete
MEKPVLLVDALNFFMRHFSVNPSVSENGHHIGGVVGFLKGIQLLIDNLSPQEVVVVWEGGGSLRRRQIYPEYKNNKRPIRLNRFYEGDLPNTVENRNYQVNLIVNLLKVAGLKQLYVGDCEADDVISYSAKYLFEDKPVIIISSDKDYYQLIDGKRISQWSPGQKTFVTPEKILKKFFIPAHNFCVARCFTGDGSDGLPGIKGAGFRTLAKRFPELAGEKFVSVEEIVNLSLTRSNESSIQLFKNIVEMASVARRNWKLMYLDVSNLSATHIQKIQGSLDTSVALPNKIKFMRLLIREGINNFDADKFFMTATSIRK